MFRLLFGELPEGRYQARIAGQPVEKSGSRTVFDVRRLLEEQLDLKARPDLMARIAASTGGIELKAGSRSEIADAFTAHLDRARPERIRRIVAWDRWWSCWARFLSGRWRGECDAMRGWCRTMRRSWWARRCRI